MASTDHDLEQLGHTQELERSLRFADVPVYGPLFALPVVGFVVQLVVVINANIAAPLLALVRAGIGVVVLVVLTLLELTGTEDS